MSELLKYGGPVFWLQAALAFKEQGFGGIKLFLGQGLRADTDTVRRVRDHVGAEFSLFGDALWRYQVGDALRLGRVLEALEFQWLEAPLAPEDLAGHRELALALAAGGPAVGVGARARAAVLVAHPA